MDAPRGFNGWAVFGGAGILASAAALFAFTRPTTDRAADAPPSTASPCEAPRQHDCSFYATCIESNVQCGPTGYALGFGEKYCGRFQAAPLSPTGVAWADSVTVCLQRSLVPYTRPEKK